GVRDVIRPQLSHEPTAELSEPADPRHRHAVATAHAALAQGVIGGDSRAQQRRSLLCGEIVRHRRHGTRADNYEVRVPAVDRDPGDLHVLAVDQQPTAAPLAVAAVAAEPADADALADLPAVHA